MFGAGGERGAAGDAADNGGCRGNAGAAAEEDEAGCITGTEEGEGEGEADLEVESKELPHFVQDTASAAFS